MTSILDRAPKHAVSRELVLQTIVIHMPSTKYEKVFATPVGWGRFGNLFAYDETRKILSLQ
jgi:hypothetical protein